MCSQKLKNNSRVDGMVCEINQELRFRLFTSKKGISELHIHVVPRTDCVALKEGCGHRSNV